MKNKINWGVIVILILSLLITVFVKYIESERIESARQFKEMINPSYNNINIPQKSDSQIYTEISINNYYNPFYGLSNKKQNIEANQINGAIFNQAMKEIIAKNYELSNTYLEVFIGNHPELLTPKYIVALNYLELKNLGKASNKLEEIIKIKNNLPTVNTLNHIVNYTRTLNINEINKLRLLTQRNSTKIYPMINFDANLSLGTASLFQQKFTEANRYFDNSINIYKSNEQLLLGQVNEKMLNKVRCLKGKCYLNMGKYNESIRIFEEIENSMSNESIGSKGFKDSFEM
ncbi:MAG: hypothetical protein NTW25_12305 [Candidatus Kapabacteria bacterium]|nr:hypothetical protein [Candidatus Kapabacteria bacterium]